jgi:hypothetical protein
VKLKGLRELRIAHHIRYSGSIQGRYADNFLHSKKRMKKSEKKIDKMKV